MSLADELIVKAAPLIIDGLIAYYFIKRISWRPDR